VGYYYNIAMVMLLREAFSFDMLLKNSLKKNAVHSSTVFYVQ
jgi:hypothetical protein